jgi:hypothetical protein
MWWWFIIGVFIIFLLLSGSSWLGYRRSYLVRAAQSVYW